MQNNPAAPRRGNKSTRAFSKHLGVRNILSNSGCTDFLTASCHEQGKINIQDKLMRNMIQFFFFLSCCHYETLGLLYSNTPKCKQTLVTNLRDSSHLAAFVSPKLLFKQSFAVNCGVDEQILLPCSSPFTDEANHERAKIQGLKSFQQLHPNQQ